MARETVALPRIEGGLGLLGVEAQYNALSSSLLIWILTEGDHHLRIILRSYIHNASARRWGTEDLTWIVTKCGTMRMDGSALWRNLCSGWAHLKDRLAPRRPANLEEWGDLPLWRPHINHVDQKLVCCSTIAQRTLCQTGFPFMSDILHPGNGFIRWEEARRREGPPQCERAFNALVQNLKAIPEIGPPEDKQDLFLADNNGDLIWQYRLPANRASVRWLPFIESNRARANIQGSGRHIDSNTKVRVTRHRLHTLSR